jgi:hypothetical protein
MKHIVEKKKEKIQEEVEEIQAVMKIYLPVNKAKIRKCYVPARSLSNAMEPT